jgi:hypothetical protein
MVASDFEAMPSAVGVEGLKSRDEALAKILSMPPQGEIEEAPARRVNATAPTDPGTPMAKAASLPPPAPANKQLHSLLWGLLVIGGLIAIGLGAAVALLSRSGGPEQVVVVGGDDPESAAGSVGETPTGESPELSGAQLSPQVPPSASAALPTENPVTDPPRSGNTENIKKAESPKNRQQQLAQAVQQKSGSFQACFSKHIAEAKATPQAVLHFSVAKAGGSAQVNIEPAALAATPLGGCLKGAATQVQFPALDEPVAFRVPVRARVSRAKGQ